MDHSLSVQLLEALQISPKGSCVRHPEVSILFWIDDDVVHSQQDEDKKKNDGTTAADAAVAADNTPSSGSIGRQVSISFDSSSVGLKPCSLCQQDRSAALKDKTKSKSIDELSTCVFSISSARTASTNASMFSEKLHFGRELVESMVNRWNEFQVPIVEEKEKENNNNGPKQDSNGSSKTLDQKNNGNTLCREDNRVNLLEDKIQKQDQSIRALHQMVADQHVQIQQQLKHILISLKNRHSAVDEVQQQILLPGSNSNVSGPPSPEQILKHRPYASEVPVPAPLRIMEKNIEDTNRNLKDRPHLNITNSKKSMFFSSVRTIEKQPPKPPQRHKSFRHLKENKGEDEDVKEEKGEGKEAEISKHRDTESFPALETMSGGGGDSLSRQELESIWSPLSKDYSFFYDPAGGGAGTETSASTKRVPRFDLKREESLLYNIDEDAPKKPRRLKTEDNDTSQRVEQATSDNNEPSQRKEQQQRRKRWVCPDYSVARTKSERSFVSCLTLDPDIAKDQAGDDVDDFSNHREVVNYVLTDSCGEPGRFTGWIEEGDYIPDGSGEMKYQNGGLYKGSWRDGHWHGFGHLKNLNGDTYEGDFVYDARHGQGIYNYENGDLYEGDFSSDKRHGKGRFLFQNGNKYCGDFCYGSFHGYGWYDFEDGDYEGEWENGLYHGIGVLCFYDGSQYSGKFQNGLAHGMGEDISPDGERGFGEWKNGVLDDEKIELQSQHSSLQENQSVL